jgi:hypothetical protein
MAEAVSATFSGRLETEVTWRSMSSSTLNFLSVLAGGKASSGCAKASLAQMTRPKVIKAAAEDQLPQDWNARITMPLFPPSSSSVRREAIIP